MPVNKAKWTKPSKLVPYPSAINFSNTTGNDIGADALVYETGLLGTAQMTMALADADATVSAKGKLWINRHIVPAGSDFGVAVPWTVITDVNTAGSGVGSPVFLSNTAGGWSLTAGTIRRQVGKVVAVGATDGAILLCPSAYDGLQTLRTSIISDSTAVSATSAETAFSLTRTIPAGFLGTGSAVKVKFTVRVTADNGADTLTIRGRIGTIDAATSTAIDVAAGDTISGEFWITSRAAPGAAVDCVGGGYIAYAGAVAPTATAATFPNLTTLATNGDLVIDVTAQWSSNNPGNSCFLETLIVEATA